MASLTQGFERGMAYPVASPTSQPKEIGVIQRLDGIRSGINEVEYQLRAFIDALHGHPPTQEATAPAYQPGIVGALSATEASIRETMGMLKQLADAF